MPKFWALPILLWLAAWTHLSPALAQDENTVRPARPTETICPTPLLQHAPGSWTPQEIWTWNERVCLGRVADLSAYRTDLKPSCDLNAVETWPDTQVLRPEFVELLLFHEPFRSVFPRRGFALRCAKFNDLLDLSDGEFGRSLQVEGSHFEAGIEATNLRLAQDFSLEGSRLRGPLQGSGMRVDGNVNLSGGSHFAEVVNLFGATIGGNLFLSGGSRFVGPLQLVGATIEGEVSANAAVMEQAFNAYRVTIIGDLQMRNAKLSGVSLLGANIGANLDLRNTSFVGTFDLSGGTIGGDLILAAGDWQWEETDLQESRRQDGSPATRLILRNVTARSLQDAKEWWEKIDQVDLLGFAYDRIGGLRGDAQETLAHRDIDWIVQQWIEKQPEGAITAQPYQQLANTLRTYGHHDLADEVVVALNDHLRENSSSLETRISLNFAWLFDYGKSPYWAFIYFALLVLIGGVLFERTQEGRGLSFADRFLFSFDSLLPAVSLRKAHDDIEIKNWVRYYFYFMRISGYLFVFMFIRSVDKIIQRHSLF